MATKPHYHHALTKGSAVHLHKAGHITAAARDKIIKSADRGMKAAKSANSQAGMPPVENDADMD